jgi:hypothetical protein
LRRHSQEVGLVGCGRIGLPEHAQISFIDQRSWLQSVAGPLPPEASCGDATKFYIEKGQQFTRR